jgi:hypothetical protein
MATEPVTRSRQVSELQKSAPEIFADAAKGAVEIRRYQAAIGYIESVEDHREHEALAAGLRRAVWALDLQQALANVSEGTYEPWDAVTAKLRARYPAR